MTLSHDLREDLQEGNILPEQFFPPVHCKNQQRGETALLYAILEDAVRCLEEGQKNGSRNQGRMAQEAEAWLFIDDYERPFSFVNICDHLGLDPAYLRRGLEDLRSQRRSVDQIEFRPGRIPAFSCSCERNDRGVSTCSQTAGRKVARRPPASISSPSTPGRSAASSSSSVIGGSGSRGLSTEILIVRRG